MLAWMVGGLLVGVLVPGINVMKPFFSLLILLQEKLECVTKENLLKEKEQYG
jgi:hypothetical protein